MLVAPVYNPIHKKWIAARDYTSDVVYKFLDPKLHSIEMYGQRYNQFLLDPANPDGGLVNRNEICNFIAEDINTKIAFSAFFGLAKWDLSLPRSIAREMKLTEGQSKLFHQEMRSLKVSGQKLLTRKELVEIAKDVKKNYPNK